MDQKRIIFRTDYGGAGPFAILGEGIAAMARALNGLHYANAGDVITDRNFIRLRPQAASARIRGSFSQSSEGDNRELVKISDGFVHFHGVGHYYFTETDVVLAGGPFVFVYIWMEINNWDVNGISVATGSNAQDIPVTGNDRLHIVLWQYEINPVNGQYFQALARAGGNDIQGITPVRTG
jgi:hypothetical protein